MEAIKYYQFNHNNLSALVAENSIMTITDSLGRIEYANKKFCDLLEIEAQFIIGENHELLKSHLHSEKLYKNLWRTIKMGNNWNGILTDVSKKGKQFWLDTTIIPIRNEQDNTLRFFSLYNDVSKNYVDLKLAKQNENEAVTFLNSMPMHVFNITRHGKILNVNKPFNNKKPNEIIETYIYDYFSYKTFNSIKKGIDFVFTEKTTYQFEFYDIKSLKVKVLFSAIISPNFNKLGGLVSATIAINEITKFKGVSDKLRESEAKFRSIYQSINVGIIVITDNNGKITEWNKGAEISFGYTEEEILGKSLTTLMSKKYSRGNIKELLIAIKKIKNNQNVDIIEMHCLKKNGEEFPVEFALSLSIIDGNSHYCAMMLDISKRKKIETKLKQKTKDLELFLYRSAHDLKAPFSSAEGLINLLKEEDDKERILYITDLLDKTIHSGKSLVENLSQASIMTVKNQKAKKVEFQLVISNCLKLLSGLKNFGTTKFNVNISGSGTFKSKPELIESIFLNLIHNAIKYSKEPTRNHVPSIEITVKLSKNKAFIKIEDNGQGIPENALKKIYNLYYRTNKCDTPGHGLGLYIVKNIVEDLNGEISVFSENYKGTSFEISLPNQFK